MNPNRTRLVGRKPDRLPLRLAVAAVLAPAALAELAALLRLQQQLLWQRHVQRRQLRLRMLGRAERISKSCFAYLQLRARPNGLRPSLLLPKAAVLPELGRSTYVRDGCADSRVDLS